MDQLAQSRTFWQWMGTTFAGILVFVFATGTFLAGLWITLEVLDIQDREVTLRAAWDHLSQDERDEIMAAVKVQNPGLSRWNKVLERLCLSVVEARLGSAREEQKSLFPGFLASD